MIYQKKNNKYNYQQRVYIIVRKKKRLIFLEKSYCIDEHNLLWYFSFGWYLKQSQIDILVKSNWYTVLKLKLFIY